MSDNVLYTADGFEYCWPSNLANWLLVGTDMFDIFGAFTQATYQHKRMHVCVTFDGHGVTCGAQGSWSCQVVGKTLGGNWSHVAEVIRILSAIEKQVILEIADFHNWFRDTVKLGEDWNCDIDQDELNICKTLKTDYELCLFTLDAGALRYNKPMRICLSLKDYGGYGAKGLFEYHKTITGIQGLQDAIAEAETKAKKVLNF